MTGYRAAGSLQLANAFHQRGVRLQLTVQLEFGSQLVGQLGGFLHLGHVIMLGAALGREGKHGHTGVDIHQLLAGGSAGDGDSRQFFRRGVGDHGTVTEDHHAVVAPLVIGNFHDKAAGNYLDAGGRLDDLQRGAQHIAGGIDRAGHHAVRVAGLEHYSAEVQRVAGHQLGGLFGRHTLGLAQFVKQVGITGGLFAGLGVDDIHAGQIGAGFSGDFLHFVDVAQQGHFGNALIGDFPGRLNGTGLGALRQNDMHDLTLGFGFDFINRRHGTFLPYVLTVQLTCRYS